MSTAERAYREADRHGDEQSLVLEHVGLVRHVLGRVASTLPVGVDRDNLEGAGMVGLVEAARRFDPAKGDFAPYARRRIRGAMLDELRRDSQLTQTIIRRIKQIEAARRQLAPPATLQQLADATGLTVEQVEQTLEAARWNRVEGSPVLEQLSHRGEAGDPAACAEQNDLLGALAEAIEALPERQRLIVTMYHLEDLRLVEIGAVLDLAAGTVSRILAVAEHRLREHLRARSQ